MKASTNHVLRTSPRAMALAVLAATSLPAAALEFSTDAGWNGSVNTTLSASASWRADGRAGLEHQISPRCKTAAR